MAEKDRDRKRGAVGAQAESELDLAGGVEGGMASGSAGGPGQEELENGAQRENGARSGEPSTKAAPPGTGT
jgi:hypothetical protein